jgi:hypothetical protein
MFLLGKKMMWAQCHVSFIFSHKSTGKLLMQREKNYCMAHVTLGINMWRRLGKLGDGNLGLKVIRGMG